MKINKEFIVEQLMITFGIIILNLGFYFFFLPQDMVTGGVAGLAVILENNASFTIKSSYTIFVLNVIFLIIGYIVLGKTFTIKTIYGSLLSPLIIFILEITNVDKTIIINQLTEVPLLLSAVLGAIGVGVGLGLVFRNGASTGGADIAHHIMHKKFHMSYITIFVIIDGIIVLLGLLVFKDIQRFIYAIGSIAISSILIDNLSIAGRAGHTLFIVTDKKTEVKDAIYKRVDRGTTILNAKGGYSNEEKALVICVIHKRELNLTRTVIKETDPNAFTFIAQTKEAVGHGFSR